jgi:hypothetical protein
VIYALDTRAVFFGPGADVSRNEYPDYSGGTAWRSIVESKAPQEPLETLADETGGRSYLNANALDEGISEALNENSAYYLLGASARDFEERVLRDHAATVAQYLSVQDGHWSLALPPDLDVLYSRGYGGYALAVMDDARQLVFSSLLDKKMLSVPDVFPEEQTFFQQPHEKSVFYGVSYPLMSNGHRALIQVAQDLESSDVILDDVRLFGITSFDQYVRSTDNDTDFTPDRLFELIQSDRAWQVWNEIKLEGELPSEPIDTQGRRMTVFTSSSFIV